MDGILVKKSSEEKFAPPRAATKLNKNNLFFDFITAFADWKKNPSPEFETSEGLFSGKILWNDQR